MNMAEPREYTGHTSQSSAHALEHARTRACVCVLGGGEGACGMCQHACTHAHAHARSHNLLLLCVRRDQCGPDGSLRAGPAQASSPHPSASQPVCMQARVCCVVRGALLPPRQLQASSQRHLPCRSWVCGSRHHVDRRSVCDYGRDAQNMLNEGRGATQCGISQCIWAMGIGEDCEHEALPCSCDSE